MLARVGRFTAKYPEEHKEACAVAVLDGETLYGRRIYPREAVRMAAAGELLRAGEQLPAFEITLEVVQKEAGKLRKERTGQAIKQKRERGTLEQRLEALAEQRVRILEFAQDRIEAKAKRGELSVEDVEKVKRIGLAEREIRARAITPASRTGTGARKPDAKDDTALPDDKGQSELVRRMARELAQRDGETDGPASSRAADSVGVRGGADAGQVGPTVAGTVAA